MSRTFDTDLRTAVLTLVRYSDCSKPIFLSQLYGSKCAAI